MILYEDGPFVPWTVPSSDSDYFIVTPNLSALLENPISVILARTNDFSKPGRVVTPRKEILWEGDLPEHSMMTSVAIL
jgi:hypothetical protein